jgi:hypothetical protein
MNVESLPGSTLAGFFSSAFVQYQAPHHEQSIKALFPDYLGALRTGTDRRTFCSPLEN